MVMKIRRGEEETRTPKQLMDFFERKSIGRAKKEKRTATISLNEKPMETEKSKAKLEQELDGTMKEYSKAHMKIGDLKKGSKAHKEAVKLREELALKVSNLERKIKEMD